MLKFNNLKAITSSSVLAVLVAGAWTTQTVDSIALANQKVTAELMLSVDISGSIDSYEYNLQMDGYAEAFRDQNVINAIQVMPNGLAVNLQFWASKPAPDIGWRVLKTKQDVLAFADELDNQPRPHPKSNSIWNSKIGTSTNITGAITAATDLIINNQYEGDIQVIDISGDGISNRRQYTGSEDQSNYQSCKSSGNFSCIQLKDASDAAVKQGIVINGLPIDSSSNQYIAAQYQSHIAGGNGSFVEVANGFEDFTRAATQKIRREIGGEIGIAFGD